MSRLMIRPVVCFIAALLVLGPVTAQAAPEKPFLPITPVTTPGGLTAWLVEDHAQPIIAVQFGFVRAGTAYEPAGKQGLVRLLSNTLDEGAGDLDSKAFQSTLENNSITLTFGAGRDTFTGTLKTLTETRETAFDLLGLALTRPRFDAEAVNRMIEANMTRIRSNMTDGDWIAARIMNDRAFDGHPYGLNSGGTLSSLPALTPDDLRAAHTALLTRDRLRIAVVGDITAEELGPVLDRIFGALPGGNTADLPDLKVQHTGTTYAYDYTAPQTQVVMVADGPQREDSDYAASVVMNHIFGGGGFGSRLMDTVREKGGMTYGIYSGLSSLDHVATLSIETSTKNETVKPLLDLVAAEITRMRDTDVSAAELRDAKGYLLGSMPSALTSTDRIAGLMLSLMLEGRPVDDLDTYRAQIAAVAVADVRVAARKWLRPDGFVTILVGAPKDIAGTTAVTDLPNVK